MNKTTLFALGSLSMSLALGCGGAERPAVRSSMDEPAKVSRAFGHLVAACDNARGVHERASLCLLLADYAHRGVHGIPRDPALALDAWEKAVDVLQASCEDGNVLDCTRAAAAIGMFVRPKGDPEGASVEPARWMVGYAEAGCSGGDAAGCAMLGVIYERAQGVSKDQARADDYYDQACERGHKPSCLRLAENQEGRRAVGTYERACAAGSGFGCAAAGQHYARGVFVEVSRARAAALFERGCSLHDMAACLLGAELLANGEAADVKRALALSATSCNEGIPEGCLLTGMMLERRGDKESAKEAYARACAFPEASACEAAAARLRSLSQKALVKLR